MFFLIKFHGSLFAVYVKTCSNVIELILNNYDYEGVHNRALTEGLISTILVHH